jgi:hypothetical protein
MTTEPSHSGVYKANELNDCTVRALANTKGYTYNEARGALQRIGRKDGAGVCALALTALYRSEGFTVELFGDNKASEYLRFNLPLGVQRNKGCCVSTLLAMPRFRTGKHVVGVVGHVFAVVDGSIIDTFCTNPRTMVDVVWSLK